MNYAELARANFDQAEQAPTTEWKITMYFYSAVHVANYTRFKTARAGADYDHTKRRMWIRQNWGAGPWSDYKALEDLSRIARYLPHQHPMGPESLLEAKSLAKDLLAFAEL